MRGNISDGNCTVLHLIGCNAFQEDGPLTRWMDQDVHFKVILVALPEVMDAFWKVHVVQVPVVLGVSTPFQATVLVT